MIDPEYKLVFESARYKIFQKGNHLQIFCASRDGLDNPYFNRVYYETATGLLMDMLAELERRSNWDPGLPMDILEVLGKKS